MKTIENTSEYKRDLNGCITCTFQHPDLGPIENTLSETLDSDLISEIESLSLIKEPSSEEIESKALQDKENETLEKLSSLDLPLHTLALAILGDKVAIDKIKESETKKGELRSLL